ncbi:MAG: lamin tail domain-containing protein [Patescibacteria group bacterium]|nr:lamin tail domain-containing protein [Patescibacteria group bacterium]
MTVHVKISKRRNLALYQTAALIMPFAVRRRNRFDMRIQIRRRRLTLFERCACRIAHLPQRLVGALATARMGVVWNFRPLMRRVSAALLILGALNSYGLASISQTLAYFNDEESNLSNTVTVGTLDFSLNSPADFSPATLNPGDTSSRTVDVSNDGSLDFQYTVRAQATSGDTDLCQALTLQASLGATSVYSGLLLDFISATTTFDILTPDWHFVVGLPAGAADSLQDKSCGFKFVYNGWQEGLVDGSTGFVDSEEIANIVNSGNWSDGGVFVSGYAVFGASDVSDTHETETGNNTSVFIGMVGSNRSVDVGGGNFSQGIRARANVTVGNNSEIGTGGVIANGSVTLGGGVDTNGKVQGASISVGNNSDLYDDAVSGGVFAIGGGTQAHQDVDAQSADLGNNSDILGTLTLPTSVSPTLGSGATVGSLVNGTPATPDTVSTVSLPAPNSFSASNDAGKDINIVAENSPLTLPPGIYRNLTSNSNVSLNLSAGTYVFQSVLLGGGNTINADAGAGKILIFVEGDFETGSNLSFNLTGGAAEDVYLEAGGSVLLGGGDWYGTIYSTEGSDPGAFGVVTGNNVDVWGGLYSREQVKLGGGNNVTLVGPYFGTYSAPISLDSVILNEIYAHPNSADAAPNNREWIELYNNATGSIDVIGWKISEMSGSSEAFYSVVAACPSSPSGKIAPYGGASTVIASGGLLVLQFCPSSAVLNDSGDAVRLYDASNMFLDGHAYPSTAVRKSHTRVPDGIGMWVDPEPTPGQPNRVSMQDLIDAGLDETAINKIIELLAARGEILVSEEGDISATDGSQASPLGNLQTADTPFITESPVVGDTSTPEVLKTDEPAIESVSPPTEENEEIVSDELQAADPGSAAEPAETEEAPDAVLPEETVIEPQAIEPEAEEQLAELESLAPEPSPEAIISEPPAPAPEVVVPVEGSGE